MPHALSIESDIDIRADKFSYLTDYYDENSIEDAFLSKAVRVHVIYRGLMSASPPRPTDYNQLRLVASQLLDALSYLYMAKIGHGHLGLRNVSKSQVQKS